MKMRKKRTYAEFCKYTFTNKIRFAWGFSKQKLNLWANPIFLAKKFCRLKNSFYLRIGIVNEIVNNNGTKYENVRKTVPQIRISGK